MTLEPMVRSILWTLGCGFVAICSALAPDSAKADGCNQQTATPLTFVDLPGNPFTPIPTPDGCWIFVALTTGDSKHGPGIAVLSRRDGRIALSRVVSVNGSPSGMVLTHDGTLLVAAAGDRVAFLDVERLVSGGDNAVLGYWSDNVEAAGRIYVNVTSDDRYLFVSNERVRSISILDLAKARKSTFNPESLVGTIPVGNAPIALTFSADERYLFSTSQSVQPAPGWPIECRPETNPEAAPDHTQGAIFVIDVKRAISNPANSVIGTVHAGCNPVRLIASPQGDVVYVTARGDHSVLAFDSQKLLNEPSQALIGRVRVGTSPVGIAAVDGGRRLIVTSSDRFGVDAGGKQSLFVIDASRRPFGPASILGEIPAGSFPREVRTTWDNQTLLVSNFNSRSLEIVDLSRLPLRHLGMGQ